MSSYPPLTVTECFYKQLKSLRLNEYPCIGPPHKEEEEIGTAQEDNIEQLIDLIQDKKSPWYEVYDWSKNCDSIRERFIRDKKSINLQSIEQYFTNLRLNDKNIEMIDSDVKFFVNLEELILTCNRITEFELANLPNSLKILDLSANYLKDLNKMIPRSKIRIQHLGLSFNSIGNVEKFFEAKYWPNLVSLDLSSNEIEDLMSVTTELSDLHSLKVLILSGNPIVLLPGYRGLVVDSLPHLFSLDDTPITKEERINFQDFQDYSDSLNENAEIRMHFFNIKNLIFPEAPEFEDDPEIFLYKHYVRFTSILDKSDDDEEDFMDEDEEQHQQEQEEIVMDVIGKSYKLKYEKSEEVEPATNIDFGEKGLIRLKYKSLKKLRDFFRDGTTVELIEKKVYYQLKNYEPPPEDEKKKKEKDKKSKEDKKDDKKDAKKKKKPLHAILETYDQVNAEEKVLASFKLELSTLLEGHVKEISKSFNAKLNVDFAHSASSSSPHDKKDADKKKKDLKGSQKPDDKNKKKPEIDAQSEPVEAPPVELNLKFQVLDFENFKELKNYYDSDL